MLRKNKGKEVAAVPVFIKQEKMDSENNRQACATVTGVPLEHLVDYSQMEAWSGDAWGCQELSEDKPRPQVHRILDRAALRSHRCDPLEMSDRSPCELVQQLLAVFHGEGGTAGQRLRPFCMLSPVESSDQPREEGAGMVFPSCGGAHGGSERLSSSPKVTQPAERESQCGFSISLTHAPDHDTTRPLGRYSSCRICPGSQGRLQLWSPQGSSLRVALSIPRMKT